MSSSEKMDQLRLEARRYHLATCESSIRRPVLHGALDPEHMMIMDAVKDGRSIIYRGDPMVLEIVLDLPKGCLVTDFMEMVSEMRREYDGVKSEDNRDISDEGQSRQRVSESSEVRGKRGVKKSTNVGRVSRSNENIGSNLDSQDMRVSNENNVSSERIDELVKKVDMLNNSVETLTVENKRLSRIEDMVISNNDMLTKLSNIGGMDESLRKSLFSNINSIVAEVMSKMINQEKLSDNSKRNTNKSSSDSSSDDDTLDENKPDNIFNRKDLRHVRRMRVASFRKEMCLNGSSEDKEYVSDLHDAYMYRESLHGRVGVDNLSFGKYMKGLYGEKDRDEVNNERYSHIILKEWKKSN